MDYARVMTALRRRRWLILLAVLGCTALTAFGSTRMKREFLASATLMPHDEALMKLTEQKTTDPAAGTVGDIEIGKDRIATVATILTSPTVISPVLQRERLKITPAKFEDFVEVKELTSQLVRVSVKDTDSVRAARMLNQMVDNFVSYYSDLKSSEAVRQRDLLEKERRSAEADLKRASDRLGAFKRNRKLSDVSEQIKAILARASQTEEARNTAEAQLRETSAELTGAQAALARMPRTITVTKSSQHPELLAKLRLDVAELKRDLDKELGIHTEEHPNVKRLKGELAEAQRRADEEQRRTYQTNDTMPNPKWSDLETQVQTRRNERDGLVAKVAKQNAQLASLQSQVASFNGVDVEESLLRQKYQLAEQRLTGVMGRLTQLRDIISLTGNRPSIAVVDRPGSHNPPLDLSQGQTIRLTALAFVLSLAMCVALAVGLEMSDHRVKSVQDVEALTQLPVVSVVPQLGGRSNPGRLCLTTENAPASHLAESYHFLANHVLRQTLQRDNTVIMAATARPGQGATTALSNLAVALSRAGRSVALVEADLRRPFLHTVYECPEQPGLADVLEERVTLKDALVQTKIKNLFLLPSGSVSSDPWSLLWQPTMGETIAALRSMVDYVIINVPSATVFADALCVAPHVDGAILVIRTSESPNGAEHKVRQWLDEVNVPVMGVVLNGCPSKEMESFEFHRAYGAKRVNGVNPSLAPPASPPVRRPAEGEAV